jgi:hypothetical protein
VEEVPGFPPEGMLSPDGLHQDIRVDEYHGSGATDRLEVWMTFRWASQSGSRPFSRSSHSAKKALTSSMCMCKVNVPVARDEPMVGEVDRGAGRLASHGVRQWEPPRIPFEHQRGGRIQPRPDSALSKTGQPSTGLAKWVILLRKS